MSVPLGIDARQLPATDTGDGERTLVEEAKHSPEAMGRLFRLHYASIAGYVQRRVGNAHDAEDIIADAFLQMVRNLGKYEQRGIPFRIWLYRIATNQINRWARRKQRMNWFRIQPECDIDSLPDAEKDSVDTELVQQVLQTLPVRLQSVLSLYYLADLTSAEVASVLNCSAGTVKSRLHEGRQLMKTRLRIRGFHNE